MNENRMENFSGQWFELPFRHTKIRMDEAGAKTITHVACELALNHASPVESRARYARQVAAFILGNMAAGCTSDEEKIALFNGCLKKVVPWFKRACDTCEDEPDLSVFA